jgi:NADP-dependent 3-hydroxy acid dehydrogenase YdfG
MNVIAHTYALKALSASENVRIIKMDVTNPKDIQNFNNIIFKLGNDLWAVVNNTGVEVTASIEFGNEKVFKWLIDVNIMEMIRLSKAYLPLLRKSKGRIVNTASIAGKNGGILNQ